MKTAVIQMGAGSAKEENIGRAAGFVLEAARKGAEFILLPEVFNYRGDLATASIRQRVAEKLTGPTIQTFKDIARTKKIFILLGSLCEKAADTSKVYNTSVLISPKGLIIAKYRKTHLFDADLGTVRLKESDCFLAGRSSVAAKVKDFNVGLSICYDLRFPETYRSPKMFSADILTVPSAFTKKTGLAHWHTLLKARAIENLCYVLAPNQIGEDHRGVECFGHSLIVGPWGDIVAEASGTKEEIIYARLDKEKIRQARKVLPKIK